MFIKKMLSDGEKPSLSRAILVALTAALIYSVAAEKTLPNEYQEIFLVAAAQAGWSRYIAKRETNKEKVE